MPAALTSFLHGARTRWDRLSAGQRRGFLYAFAVAGIAVALLALVSTYQPYGVLFHDLEPGEAQAAVESLRAAGVPHELTDGGRTLRVPEDQIDSMRVQLAAAGTVGKVGNGYEILDTLPFGASDASIKLRHQRALEGELARTIMSIRGVRSARVHLTAPEPSVFEKDARKPSASVVVALEGSTSLEREEVRGIRNLVAHAVERLDSKDVTIVDDRGRMLTEDVGDAAKVRERQHELERELEQRLVTLLTPVVGEGQLAARVSVDLDSTSLVETSKQFHPDQSAVRSEERQEEERKVGGDPAGLAGAQANIPGSTGGATFGSGSVGTSSREVTNYEVSFTQRRTERGGGTIRRISAAILVAPRQVEEPAGSGEYQTRERSPNELERLSVLAKTAIGFDAARGDQLQIDSMSFVASQVQPAMPLSWVPILVPVFKIAAVAVLALVIVLMIGRPLFRGGRRALIEVANLYAADPAHAAADPIAASQITATLPAPSEEMQARRERALEAAMENSERAAEIVRAWLASDAEEQVERAELSAEVTT